MISKQLTHEKVELGILIRRIERAKLGLPYSQPVIIARLDRPVVQSEQLDTVCEYNHGWEIGAKNEFTGITCTNRSNPR